MKKYLNCSFSMWGLAIRFDAGLPGDFEINTMIRQGHSSRAVYYRLLSLPVYLVARVEDILSRVIEY